LRAKTEKKNIFFLFFVFRAKTVFLPSTTVVLQIHLYTYVLRVCAVCYVEGRVIPTLSRMRFSTEQLPFIERYFFASKNSFSLMTIGTRIISFLCRLREASTVLRKSKLFPLVRLVSLQKRAPTLLLPAQCILLSHIVVCSLIIKKNLGHKIPNSPIVVSCHSSSV
jgi:hypothetical protein